LSQTQNDTVSMNGW